MIWFKVINHSQKACRFLHYNGKTFRKTLTFEAPRLENDSVHKTLEDLPAYQNHVLPTPKSCQELLNSQIFNSSSERCTCQTKCRLSKVPRSEFVEKKPKSIITVAELFSSDKLDNSVQEPKVSTRKVLQDDTVEYFKQRILRKLLVERDLDNSRLIEAFSKTLQVASDLELTQIMMHTSLWPFKRETNFALLTCALDKECSKRILRWPVEQQLYVADIWYHLNMSRICLYNSKVIENVTKILNNLSKSHLIHLLFIVSLKRKASSEVMLKFQKVIESIIDLLLIEEVVVIAMAYFKTANKITSPVIISTMINVLNKSFTSMASSEFISVVKTLRYSYRYDNQQLIEAFLNKTVENRAWKNYFPIASHLCLLAHSHYIYLPKLLDKVIADMTEFQNVRLKDIAMVLLTASRFNHSNPNVLKKLTEYCRKEFNSRERQQEIHSYYQQYISSLLSLSYLGIFIQEELQKAFNNNNHSIKHAHNFNQDLASLDCITEIDEPSYEGDRLLVEERFEILRRTHLHYPTSNQAKTLREKITMDLQIVLQELFVKKIPMIHILPYMDDPVFLLVFDKHKQLCEPTAEFMNLVSKGHIVKPTNEHDWVVIWPLSKKELHSKGQLVGRSLAKERNFVRLGFKLIKVPLHVSFNYELSKRFLQDNLKCFMTIS